ncbi:MAG: cellulase family glycosylhydrolase [Lachnospiraceae bacterium]|nr:cellulase family glycosylhydrolase [Lachnospiraceae bacterium]
MKHFTGYMHGVNLGGWLSQCDHTKERYETFITKKDIEIIKSWGLDHIRVPVDYDLVEEKDGTYKEDGFGYIQRAVDWAGECGLNMVLDLHRTFGYSFDDAHNESGFFDNEAYQERFYKLWEQFAGRFGKYSDRLCFELLNEVTSKDYCERWNRILTECIRRVRVYAPDIKILVGGYYNNSIMALKDLCEPYDENIIYNFHCYEPLIFTHQGAYWINTMDPSFRMPFEVTYGEYLANMKAQLNMSSDEIESFDPADKMGIDYFELYFKEAIRVAEERNVCLYCGEYGVIELADPADAYKWYDLITTCFDKYGIGRAAWTYKEMDFGLNVPEMEPVRRRL